MGAKFIVFADGRYQGCYASEAAARAKVTRLSRATVRWQLAPEYCEIEEIPERLRGTAGYYTACHRHMLDSSTGKKI